jgi:hypothetical protein
MEINFTEEEAKTPVTFGDMKVLIEEIFKTIAVNKEIEDDMLAKLLDSVIDPMLEHIKEIEYNQTRDRMFLMRLFSDLSLAYPRNIEEYYAKWCERFDKLNKKEKQDVSETNC